MPFFIFLILRELRTMTPEQIANIVTQVIDRTSQPQPAAPSQQADDFIPATHVYDHEKPQSISEMATSSFTPVAEEPVIQTSHPVPASAVSSTNAPPFAITPMEQDLVVMLKHLLDVEKQDLATVENVFIQQALRVLQRIEAKVDSLEEMITDELLGASKDDEQPQPQLIVSSLHKFKVYNDNFEAEIIESDSGKAVAMLIAFYPKFKHQAMNWHPISNSETQPPRLVRFKEKNYDEKEETEQKVHVQIVQNSFVDDGEKVIPEISKEEIRQENQHYPNIPRSSGKPSRAKGNAGKRRRRKRNRKNKR